jgi:hypothetical protein
MAAASFAHDPSEAVEARKHGLCRADALKASPNDALKVAQNMRCWWVNSMRLVNRDLPISYFDRLGVVKLS